MKNKSNCEVVCVMMKKVLNKCNKYVLAAFIAAAILIVILAINLLLYNLAGFIIGLPASGGEISVTYGIGMTLKHYYPLTTLTDQVQDSTSLTFSPVSMIFWYLVLYVIAIFIAKKIKDDVEWELIREKIFVPGTNFQNEGYAFEEKD